MKEPENPTRNIVWINHKLETTTGPENDFWYDRLLDLKAEYDDQNGAQLEAMNGGDLHV
jgi:hypothetical protein